MSILRYGREVQMGCEKCAATTDLYDSEDFIAMVKDAKREGWTIRKRESGVEHFCQQHGRDSEADAVNLLPGVEF